MSEVLVVVEVVDGVLRASSAAAIGFALRWVESTAGRFDIVALGERASEASRELALYGASRVYLVDGNDLSLTCPETYVPTIVGIAKECGATALLATATVWGKDVMPRVAVRLDAGYVSDCVGVTREDERLLFAKPMYAGNLIGTCVVETPVAVLTVRQCAIPAAQPTEGEPSEVVSVLLGPPSSAHERIEVLGVEGVESCRPDLTSARRVVAGGRGLGARFSEMLGPLADALDAAIGASRAACDYGHAPGDLQVGQTGKVIAPDLYVAVGISGAIQHTAGIRGAKCVVAVDHDPDAPIFAVADYGLVADAFDAVPKLIDALRRYKQTGP